MKIIRTSSPVIPPDEWEMLVSTVRMNPDLNSESQVSARHAEPDYAPTLESPPHSPPMEAPLAPLTASPVPINEPIQSWQEQESLDAGNAWRLRPDPAVFHTVVVEPAVAFSSAAEQLTASDMDTGAEQKQALARGAQTEPMPCRDIPKESTAEFLWRHQEAPDGCNQPLRHLLNDARVGFMVDWNTSQRGLDQGVNLESGHQADEGAGTPQAPNSSTAAEQSQVAQASSMAGRNALSGDDPVAWISLEMQNECHGPYLLRAFKRCCILYEADRARAPSL